MRTSLRKPLADAVLLGAVCVAVSLLLGWSSLARRGNLNFYDLYFRQRGAIEIDTSSSNEIVIVAIDDATLARYGALPLNRSLLAEGIRRIATVSPRPRLLALDI